jgi:predicted flavoprotein YhiN
LSKHLFTSAGLQGPDAYACSTVLKQSVLFWVGVISPSRR